MKKQPYFFIPLLGIIFVLLLNSCEGVDRRLEYKDTTDANNWIYSQMEEYYYWYKNIPASSSLAFYATPDIFFSSLLSTNEKKGGEYVSWIQEKTATTKSIDETSSYGFEFKSYTTDSTYRVRVLYVLPNSPANDAGLKRGDWILSFDNKKITSTNYTELLTGSGINLTLGTPTDYTKNIFTESGSLTLATARAVNNDPILAHKVLNSASGSKIGYLMYNQFLTGPSSDANDLTYDNELRSLFADFKNQNVKDFVLDLRYNSGGYISTGQLLGSMLAPSSALGSVFCKIQYNDKAIVPKDSVFFDANSIKGGANLNLSRLYVLVSSTTASTAELIINGLKPFMDVILIGTTTEGNNLTSMLIEDANYNWIIQPVVGILSNSEDNIDYASGFTPDVVLDESTDYNTFKELGDENELLLKEALTLINGASVTQATRTKSIPSGIVTKQSSLDRKKPNAAWLAPIVK